MMANSKYLMCGYLWFVLSAQGALGRLGERQLATVGKAVNIGDTLAGIDILKFSTLEANAGVRQAVFEGTYEQGRITADGLFQVPDGLTFTRATWCSTIGKSTLIKDERSLMDSQTTGVSFKVGAGEQVKGSLENSNTFKSMSKEMYSSDSYFVSTELVCKIYQSRVDHYSMPHLTKNFVTSLAALKDKPVSDSAYITFLDTFGTHFTSSSSVGSKYVEVRQSSAYEMTKMLTEGVDVTAAASISALGFSSSVSVKNSKELKQSQTFSSNSKQFSSVSLGSPLPSGSTPEEVRDSWMSKTLTSTGLAAVGDFTFDRLDSLLAPQRLADINADFARYGLNAKFLAADLAKVQQGIASAIDNYCTAKGARCDGILKDRAVPAPVTAPVDLLPIVANQKSLSLATGGAPFGISSGNFIPSLFGDSNLTYEIEIMEIRTWWTTDLLSGIQVVYRDGKGVIRYGEVFGQNNSPQLCTIQVPVGGRITQVAIQLNNNQGFPELIQVGTDYKMFSPCGKDQGGESINTSFNNDSYLIGFHGRAGSLIDALGLVKAAPVF